jgi:hypothetical protein
MPAECRMQATAGEHLRNKVTAYRRNVSIEDPVSMFRSGIPCSLRSFSTG